MKKIKTKEKTHDVDVKILEIQLKVARLHSMYNRHLLRKELQELRDELKKWDESFDEDL